MDHRVSVLCFMIRFTNTYILAYKHICMFQKESIEIQIILFKRWKNDFHANISSTFFPMTAIFKETFSFNYFIFILILLISAKPNNWTLGANANARYLRESYYATKPSDITFSTSDILSSFFDLDIPISFRTTKIDFLSISNFL